MEMRRIINKISLLFVSIGALIGSGWLMGSLLAAKIAGPAAILSWILGGILVIIVALTFSELSAMLPVTGGIARFPQFSHGPLVSYIMTWLAWISYALLPPIEVQALVQYLAPYFPWLIHYTNGNPGLSILGYLVTATLLLVMSVLNIYGLRIVTRFNNALVIVKLLIPILTIIALVSIVHHTQNFTAHGGFYPNGIKGVLSALPMAGIIFSFFGFRLAVELGGEVKNPQVALPLALIGSLVVCIIIYSLLQFAFIGAVPIHALIQGWSHIKFSGDSGPFVGIASGLGADWLIALLFIAAIISPFSSALMVVTTTSRVNYAMSKNGYAPQNMLKLNKKGVPYVAVIINFIVGLILLTPFAGWQKIASFITIALVISHSIVPISLVSLRKQVPNMYRPFRLPMATIISLLAFIILDLVAYCAGWDNLWKMYIAGLIGIIFLVIYRLTQGKNKPPLYAKHAWWLLPYFIGMALFSYYGNFGGGQGKLPFGFDMIYITIFSIIIFFLGTMQRLNANEAQEQIDNERHLFPESYNKNLPKKEQEIVI